jgi:hypothetical protein
MSDQVGSPFACQHVPPKGMAIDLSPRWRPFVCCVIHVIRCILDKQFLRQMLRRWKTVVKGCPGPFQVWLVCQVVVLIVVHVKSTNGSLNGVTDGKQKGGGVVDPSIVVMTGSQMDGGFGEMRQHGIGSGILIVKILPAFAARLFQTIPSTVGPKDSV